MIPCRVPVLFFALLAPVIRAEQLTVGPFKGLDTDDIAPEWRTMMVQGNEDCAEVESYRIPKHATPDPLEILDGGSRMFAGNGYVIVVRQSIFPIGGIGKKLKGCLYGYDLYSGSIDDLMKAKAPAAIVSRVWYLSNKQMNSINSANAEQLKARMPKNWLKGEDLDEPTPVKQPPEKPTKSGAGQKVPGAG